MESPVRRYLRTSGDGQRAQAARAKQLIPAIQASGYTKVAVRKAASEVLKQADSWLPKEKRAEAERLRATLELPTSMHPHLKADEKAAVASLLTVIANCLETMELEAWIGGLRISEEDKEASARLSAFMRFASVEDEWLLPEVVNSLCRGAADVEIKYNEGIVFVVPAQTREEYLRDLEPSYKPFVTVLEPRDTHRLTYVDDCTHAGCEVSSLNLSPSPKGKGTIGGFFALQVGASKPKAADLHVLTCAHVLLGDLVNADRSQAYNDYKDRSADDPNFNYSPALDYAFLHVDSNEGKLDNMVLGDFSYTKGTGFSDFPTNSELSRNVGKVVMKMGQTTGVTFGVLESVSSDPLFIGCAVVAWQQGTFATSGDSGSLYWLDCDKGMLPFALHRTSGVDQDGKRYSLGSPLRGICSDWARKMEKHATNCQLLQVSLECCDTTTPGSGHTHMPHPL